MEKQLGRIIAVSFGFGGYQNAQFGIWFTLGGDAWSVDDGRGAWARWYEGCKWTPEDQMDIWADVCTYARDLCTDAGVLNIADLVNKPIEVIFENRTLHSWRILKEVL